MAEAAQNRVQSAMKEFIDTIDRTKLRPIQKQMYLCNVRCMDDPAASMEEVQRCVERCSGPAQRAQQYVQSELEQFQSSLGRCVQMCQDDIKDKVGVNTAEADMNKYRKEFEACAIACCDKNIQELPYLLIKIKESLESQ